MQQSTPLRSGEPLLAVAALGSGAALIAALVLRASLSIALSCFAAAASSLFAFRWSHLDGIGRRRLRLQLSTGLYAGLAATAVYDLSRLALVHLGQLPLSPFEVFELFGQLIIGTDVGRPATLLVGTAYHLLNGICFSTAYCLLLGGRDWRFGIGWALGLEAAMLGIYPGWLDLDAMLGEFIAMSVVGHLAYGAVLGLISQRRLAKGAFVAPPGEADAFKETARW